MNSKRLISTFCAITFLGVVWFLATSSFSAPANNVGGDGCEGCDAMQMKLKTMMKLTGDPAADKAAWARAHAAVRQREAAHAAESAARNQALFEKWYGTRLSVRNTVEDQATIALHQYICDLFASDPAAPDARAAEFREWLAPAG